MTAPSWWDAPPDPRLGVLPDDGVKVAPGALVDHRYEVRREITRGATRLIREGKLLARCRHPGVVRALDGGTCSVHGPYLALEMIEGRSLESYVVAREQLSLPSTARIGEQLCAAIAHVDDQGIVHRDIKTSNVLIRAYAEFMTRGRQADPDGATLFSDHGALAAPSPR